MGGKGGEAARVPVSVLGKDRNGWVGGGRGLTDARRLMGRQAGRFGRCRQTGRPTGSKGRQMQAGREGRQGIQKADRDGSERQSANACPL